MKLSLRSFTGFSLGASDGEIGSIKEVYFDDATWTVRYLIVKTGNWLSERVILISPQALTKLDYTQRTFHTNLSMKQVKDSPDIDTDKPVYRQEEAKLYDYFPWQPYWGFGVAGAGVLIPSVHALRENENRMDEPTQNSHLRSSKKVTGYHIHATDGELGHIEDFIINVDNWTIEFMIIEAGTWLAKRKLMLSPDWIVDINWATSRAIVNVSVDTVKNSPEFDKSSPVNEVYEKNLRDYYGKLIR